MRDDNNGEEEDGYDEALVPVDYAGGKMIRDDDLYDILVKPLPDEVHVVCLFDCCHSDTVMDVSRRMQLARAAAAALCYFRVLT